VKPHQAKNNGGRRRQRRQFEKKPDKLYFEGIVVETLPATSFICRIDRGEKLEPLLINSALKSFLKVKRVKVIKGDKVMLELDPMDLSQGTIVSRIN
jgi:translation initiation factor IF-1